MFRRNFTINLNDYRSERVEVEFPLQLLPPGMPDANAAFEHARAWVDAKLREQIEAIVRREAARGNRIDPPLVGPPERLVPPAEVVQMPPAPVAAVRGGLFGYYED